MFGPPRSLDNLSSASILVGKFAREIRSGILIIITPPRNFISNIILTYEVVLFQNIAYNKIKG
jgi:hypothetical protein